jgi:hypothetical protein
VNTHVGVVQSELLVHVGLWQVAWCAGSTGELLHAECQAADAASVASSALLEGATVLVLHSVQAVTACIFMCAWLRCEQAACSTGVRMLTNFEQLNLIMTFKAGAEQRWFKIAFSLPAVGLTPKSSLVKIVKFAAIAC